MADMKRVFEVTTAVAGIKTYLYAADGTEELGRPFEYHVTLLAEKELPLDDLLGKPITVSVENADGGSERYFNGLVSQVAASGKRGQFHVVTATLRPWLWVLSRISDNKIFQNKTVTEIIQEVFDENGFSDYQMKVKASYRTRDYCVQYDESSFDFVSRLMEEEGIYYFFEHRDGKHDLILYDAESTHNSCEVQGGDTLPFRLPGGHAIGVEHVNHWELSHALQTEAYVLDSYNFEKPKADLKQATKDAQQHGKPGLERYEYGQLYPEAGDGGALVKVRCEEHLAKYRISNGVADAPGICCGFNLSLDEHPLEDFNDEYLITSTSIKFQNNDIENFGGDEEAFYECRFTAIDAKLRFRTSRRTPKSLVRGPQTAVVVGPSGEEIWTDKYGRVKVQFHWDRLGKQDENSSCWVRVATTWAGNVWGSISIPRVGQEVIVDFLEGDPDQPIITGSVYNDQQMPPFALPDNKTQSGMRTRSTAKGNTQSFNELRFEDKKGSEEIYFHAETNFNRIVENNDTLIVGVSKKDKGDQTIEIQNDRTVTLNEGTDDLTIKQGDRIANIDEGDDKLTVKAGNQKIDVKKKITIKAGDELKITVGQASLTMKKNGEITIKGMKIKIDGMQEVSAKGLKVAIAGKASAEMKSPATKVEGSGMLDLKAGGMAKLKGGVTMIG